MAASTLTPYEILGAKPSDKDLQLRIAYRKQINEYKKDRLKSSEKRTISAEKFRLVCRAYETLSDPEKRKRYDQNEQWVSDLPLANYTLQQSAAEPELIEQLKSKLQNATLRQINAQDPDTGHTPLYCAARACNVEAVHYLTEQGAEPDLKQKTESTALHVSAFYEHPEMVLCLLESGANYLVKNAFGNLPENECTEEDVKHAFIDMKKTPFVQAAANQMDWLKKNIDGIPDHIDEEYYRQRQTLLHCASKKGYEDLVRWLVKECSANLDIVDLNLNSALHLAAYGGYVSIVKYLLRRGANSLLVNKWGMTAEQEGIAHGEKMTELFQSIRSQDMFEMAANGVEWWFKYYFGENSPDAVNSQGTSLLYIACRYGQTSVAKWLLDHGANINIQLRDESGSTPLHGAAYHRHVSTVELLLDHGADVNIKNRYGETVFENARSDEIKHVLEKHRMNLQEEKLLSVHLYGDGKKAGNEPLAKIQLRRDATRADLLKAMPESIPKNYDHFSIARRPIIFDDDKTTVLSAVCRARYAKTKFVELPLCIIVHERARFMNSGHMIREEAPDYTSREFQNIFRSACKTSKITIKAQSDKTQTITLDKLSFTFAANCVNKDLSIEVRYIPSPDINTFHLPKCVCLFQTSYCEPNDKLNDMPIVSFGSGSNIRLYNWVESSPYWFAPNTRQICLPFIGGVHALIRHVNLFPSALTLPPDMLISTAMDALFSARESPVSSLCLKIREHNSKVFPHIAYHGTSVRAIPSILMDGLVMPSTVVSSGFRVCPPDNHIARQKKVFGVEDFSNGIFVSPSVHYCSDSVYAVKFSYGDQELIPVLECSLKDGSFKAYPTTVKGYRPRTGDDLHAIEWRLTNPADIEIISVLFIPVSKSRKAAARARAKKLGVNPNDVA